MTLRPPSIQRDHERTSVTALMDLIVTDPERRFELSFTLNRLGDETLTDLYQFCQQYGERDRTAFMDQLLNLDPAGAGGLMEIRLVNAYAAAAPAFAHLPHDYSSVLMWLVLGAMDTKSLAQIPLNELTEYQLAAIRGMVLESYVASSCRAETTIEEYATLGSDVEAIAEILPELRMRGTIDSELVADLTGESGISRPLGIGVL